MELRRLRADLAVVYTIMRDIDRANTHSLFQGLGKQELEGIGLMREG